MEKKHKVFYYSEKNPKPFCLPEKYSRYDISVLPPVTENVKKNVKKKKKVKIDVYFFIRVAAVVVMVASLANIADKALDYYNDIAYEESQKDSFGVIAVPNEVLAKRDTPAYPEIETEDGPVVKLDYPDVYRPEAVAQLGLAYPDFVYYIYMEMGDFVINYPVVQAEDNDFYLRRNMDGEDNLSGTLFLDYRNDRDTFKGHNIIYGHNMQNGTMFGRLKDYEKRSFFEEHNMIYTFSAGEVIAWQIFSAYETTTDNYYIKTVFKDDGEYLEFIQTLQKDSFHKTDIVLTEESDVLTLSTCHKYDTNKGRFVVHAVKVGSTPLV